MAEAYRCQCGLLVVFNERERETLHEAPVCQWFKDAVRETNGKTSGERIGTLQGNTLRLSRRTWKRNN